MEKLCTHWKDFNEISGLVFFRKPVEKIPGSLKYGKNNGYII